MNFSEPYLSPVPIIIHIAELSGPHVAQDPIIPQTMHIQAGMRAQIVHVCLARARL